jgi:hypothetical protein
MRAPRFVVVVAAALGGVALLPTAASAGGGWSTPGRSSYVPAQVAVVRGTFWAGATEGTISDGPYIAYLLPARRWIQGHRVPEAAIPVGEVMITRMAGHSFRARVAFPVPDLPAGLYHIQYCNDPCTVEALGDLIGSDLFAIGATRTEGRLLMLAQRLRSRISEVTYRVRQKASAEIREVTRELRTTEYRVTTAELRVRELTEMLGTTRTALEDKRSTGAAAFVIASGLLLITIALLVMLVVTTKRLRTARLDAELQAMTHGQVRSGSLKMAK